MKNLCDVRILLFLFTAAVTLFSCSDDDNDPLVPQPTADENIVELALDTPELSNLVAALQRASLVSALEADGNFTVLAPDNTAFDLFLQENNFASIEEIPVDVLEQVLRNHVIPGDAALTAADLASIGIGYATTLAQGAGTSNLSLQFDASGATVELNGVSTVTTADVDASNGIIHIVDKVIPQANIVNFASVDTRLSALVEALTTATPGTDFATTLSGDGPFTVFAPIDNAFQALLDSNVDWDELGDIDEELLVSVLQHHVINGNVRSSDLSEGLSAETLEGDELTITNLATAAPFAQLTDGTGNEGIGVIQVDIQATNGVIHLIDTVLIPDTEN